MGYWLEFSGYIGGAEEQPRSASDALFNIHLLPFLIAAAVAFLILQFYKLDRKTMEKIIGEIAADAEVAEGSENTADARVAEGSETE
jgi:Na+/melibiose symporter-like transporter